jgi:hypothetical protein
MIAAGLAPDIAIQLELEKLAFSRMNAPNRYKSLMGEIEKTQSSLTSTSWGLTIRQRSGKTMVLAVTLKGIPGPKT